MAPGILIAFGLLGMAGLAAAASSKKTPPSTSSPLVPAGSGAPPSAKPKATIDMPASLQAELADALRELTFDPLTGNLAGPITADAVRKATELAGRLKNEGFLDAEKKLREIVDKAVKFVPSPPPVFTAPLPGVPADLLEKINRAIALERDPAKLAALLTALAKLPASSERDSLIALLKETILQIKARQEAEDALKKTEEVFSSPGIAPGGGSTVPTTSIPPPVKPVAVPPAEAPSSKVVEVKSGEGLSQILKRLGISPTNANMKLFRAINVPRGADGKAHKSVDLSRGGLQPLDAGDLLFVPESLLPAGTPSRPAPVTPAVEAVSIPLSSAGDRMIASLNQLQASKGGDVKAAKGREDQSLVRAFQAEARISTDGKAGPGTMLEAAKRGAGTGVMPFVMYWPTGANATRVNQYRNDLRALAAAFRARGDSARATALEQSADRERGQAGIVGPLA